MSLAQAHREEVATRERRCIVTGETCAQARLVRFVVGPEGEIVPDLAGKLPGRGIWVTAEREMLAKAPFAKAAKQKVRVPPDLAGTVERLIVRRMQDDLGLAKRSGALISGFDNVVRALEAALPPRALVEASDGAADGRRKIANLALSRKLEPAVIDALDSGEISVALGRENVIHAALTSGQLAERLIFEAGRLSGFRKAALEPERARREPTRNQGIE